MQFRSKRLILKEFQKDDFDLFYSVFSDRRIMRYALIDRYSCKEDLLPYFLEVMNNNKKTDNRSAYQFAVFLSSSEEFIGFADIEVSSQNTSGGCSEIGYFLLEDFWGNGYATEIARTLVKICFTNLHLHRVCASCNANNLQSENVMKKIGMTKEGCFRRSRFKEGRWDDELRYSVLIEEWKQKKKSSVP